MTASAARYWCAALMVAFFLLAGPWAAPAVHAGLVEAAIWQKVQTLLAQGKELEACREAVKLQEYKDSPVYKKAQKELARRGISLADPLASYTAKRIVDLQNETQAVSAATGQLPKPGLRPRHKDAWGHPMRVELVTRGSFVYAIRSAGPDGRFMSDDDLVVGVRDERALDPTPANPWDTARQKGRSSMVKGRGVAEDGGSGGGMGGSMGGGSGGGSGGGGSHGAGSGSSSPELPPAVKGAKEGHEVEVTLDELLKSK